MHSWTALGCSRGRWKLVSEIDKDCGGKLASLDVAHWPWRPDNEIFLDRPNSSEPFYSPLSKRCARHETLNFAAEYMCVELSDDNSCGLRVRNLGIRARHTCHRRNPSG